MYRARWVVGTKATLSFSSAKNSYATDEHCSLSEPWEVSSHNSLCGQHMSTLHLVDKVLGLCFRSAWLVAFVPGRMPFQESQQSQPSKTSSPRRYHKILTDAVAALEATAESSEIVCIRIYRLMQKPSIQSQNYEPRLKTIENCKIG